MKIDSYRGITLTSMVAKVLEFLLLKCLELVFLEAGLPHINQSAYRCAVSCEDAVFATQEIVAKYLREGNQVYMCLHDLQRAFDSIEYSVLLEADSISFHTHPSSAKSSRVITLLSHRRSQKS